MRNLRIALQFTAIIAILLYGATSEAQDIRNANYGSVIVRDGSLLGLGVGHAGVVILPLYGDAPGSQLMIAQANGYVTPGTSVVTYATFLGTNNYKGHFKTGNSQWATPAFRADVVKYANQAMGRSYTFWDLYAYTGDWLHTNDVPYYNVVPTDFRCDGLAEWSVEQALGENGSGLSDVLGFYSSNSATHWPTDISALGLDDTAYALTIDSDNPPSGVYIIVSTADSLGQSSGSTISGGGLRRLYSSGKTVTLTAPATAANGNSFQTWWGCTAANGGTLNLSARTCTTSMYAAAHYTASYGATVSAPSVTTNQVSSVSANSATFSATITSDGGSPITDRRFEWGIVPNWTYATNTTGGTITVSGNTFSQVTTGLQPNTQYQVRAWAKNNVDWTMAGTVYFTTGSNNCSYSFSPTSANPAGNASTGSISVTGSPSGCTGNWSATASSSGNWLTLTGTTSNSGAGTWSVPYSYSTNPSTTSSRVGTVSFSGAFPSGGTFTVTQSPSAQSACSYSITPVSAPGAGGGGSGAVQVTGSPAGCTGSWSATASSNGSWLTLTGTTSNSGAGAWSVPYSFGGNPSTTSSRVGTVSFSGTFPSGGTFTLTQDPSTSLACSYSFSPPSATVAGSAGSGSVQVSGSPAGCTGSWSAAVTSGTDLVTLTGSTGNSGPGTWTVPYSYTTNPSTTSNRGGTIQFYGSFAGNGTFLLTQSPSSPSSCSYAISPSSASAAVSAGTGSVQVTSSPAGCTGSWTVSSSDGWLSLTGTNSGTNSGSWSIPYSYSANPAGSPARSATLSFTGSFPAGGIFTLSQPAGLTGGGSDSCSSAIIATGTTFTDTQATTSATADVSDPTPGCGNGSRSASVWYKYTAPSTGTLMVDTVGSSYDTILSAWTGSCGALTAVAGACNDDYGGYATSRISFAANSGTTYYFLVTSYDGTGGSLTLNLTLQSTQPSLPNLTPYTPSGWSDKIVVSTATNTTMESTSFAPSDSLYVDWAVANTGTSAADPGVYFKLLVDGNVAGTWVTNASLSSAYYVYVTDFSIGSLAAGSHTITIVADSTAVLTESDENDNQYTKTIWVGGQSGASALGDFNGDGKADVLWRIDSGGLNAMWLMNQTTKSVGQDLEPAPSRWIVVGIGDFNGDGKADILWRDPSTGENAVWLMNGTTKTLGTYLESAGANWTVAGVGDFNGDGKADILWRDRASGANAMWLMNGQTKVLGTYIESAGTNWNVVGIGDFNGDGKADVLWRDDTSGSDAVWLMNGAAKVVGSYLEWAPARWRVAGVGDFNGDGRADILWRDRATGEDAIWLMNGTTKVVGAYTESAPTVWSVVGIGDLDGDGKADVFWRDTAGNDAVWLMNGTTKALGAYTEWASPPWRVVP